MSNPTKDQDQTDQTEQKDTGTDGTDTRPATTGHSAADSQAKRNAEDESPS